MRVAIAVLLIARSTRPLLKSCVTGRSRNALMPESSHSKSDGNETVFDGARGPSGQRATTVPTIEGVKQGGALVLRASGDWLARTIGSVEKTVEETSRADLGGAVRLDCTNVGQIDTAGALLLETLSRDLSKDGRSVELGGIASRDEPLFEVVRQALGRERPAQKGGEKPSAIMQFVTGVGATTIGFKDEIVIALNVIGGTIIGGLRRMTGQTQGRFPAIINQLDQMGLRAVPIIFLMSFLIGGIISQQGAFQLRRFGAEVFAINLAGILVLRELGVVLTAIMIAGRSGSAITAEIGSMKMREEVDALNVIGLNPVGVLVFPRMVALMIALPLLTFISNFAGLLGSMITLKLYSGISFANFTQGVQQSVDLFTVFSGVIKAPFMAVVIGLVASMEGMKVGGSAESLGLRVTASVVKSIFLVILMDGLFAIFYASIGL